MAASGAIHFNSDYTTIKAVDSDTNEQHSFDVTKPFPAPFSPPSSQDTAYNTATPSTSLAITKKRAVPSDLLHRRLGHRTVNSIIVGSRNDVWRDTTIRRESDSFCDSCQIVTARKSNRGKSPLDIGTVEMQSWLT
jgi:hypothetical protein